MTMVRSGAVPAQPAAGPSTATGARRGSTDHDPLGRQMVAAGDLHGACRRGDMREVDRLLRLNYEAEDLLKRERRPDTLTTDGGPTALHCAVQGGHPGIVEMLLCAAPFASMLLQPVAARPGDAGPAETPRELAVRLSSESIVGGGRWRDVVVAIDHAIQDDRERAQLVLGEGLTLLAAGDMEEALQRARYGLKCDPASAELQGLLAAASGALEAAVQALLDEGQAARAFEEAQHLHQLAPELQSFSELHRRSQALAERQRACDRRVKDISSSLMQYDRATSQLVGAANDEMKEAQKEAEAAMAHATAMASWEGKAAQMQDGLDRTRAQWQARAIRKMRNGLREKCLLAWIDYTTLGRVHKRALRHCAAKFLRRQLWIVWRGWCKFHAMANIEQASEQVSLEKEAAQKAFAEKSTAVAQATAAAQAAAAARQAQQAAEAQVRRRVSRSSLHPFASPCLARGSHTHVRGVGGHGRGSESCSRAARGR
jgi:hypothetical protein